MNRPVPVTRGKILIMVLSLLFIFAFSISFSIYASNRAVEAAQETQRQQAIASITPVCRWLYATSDNYKETPPQTPTGKKQAVSVEELIRTFECEKLVDRG